MFNLAEITEDVYRISIYVPEINLQFNHSWLKMMSRFCFTLGSARCFLSFGRHWRRSSIPLQSGISDLATSNLMNAEL